MIWILKVGRSSDKGRRDMGIMIQHGEAKKPKQKRPMRIRYNTRAMSKAVGFGYL